MRPTLAALCMFIMACTQCGEGTSLPGDASADAGSLDARVDARRDAALVPEGGGGWTPYTALPSCSMQVAVDPSAVVPGINWIPCPGKAAQCDQIDMAGWEQDTNAPPWITYARTSSDGRYLVIAHAVPTNRLQLAVYAQPSLSPRQAWLFPQDVSCAIVVALGANTGAIIQDKPTLARAASGSVASVLDAPTFGDLIPALPPQQDVAYAAVSDDTLAFDIQPNHWVARMPLGQAGYAVAKGLKLSEPIIVGNDVYAHHEYGINGWSGLARVNADGSTTGYRYVPQRHISGMRADSTWVLWLETFGDPNNLNFNQPNAELWGAPYTSDPSVLAATAKKIAVLPGVRTGLGDPAYSAGYYAVYAALTDSVKPTLYVVRVSDGTVKTLDVNGLVGPDAQHGYYLSRIASVSATEVTGILSQVLAAPAFGFVRLKLGPW